MHYYQFNIGDWALEAGHLSLEEEAVYLRLINHYLNTEQPIPSETQWVIRRLRLETQSVIDHVLAEFFELTDKGWVHIKCEEMLKAYRKTVKKNRANGAKGGRPRKHLGSKETQSEPTGNPLATQTKPTGNPNQEPLTNNHKPVNQVKEHDQLSVNRLFDEFYDKYPKKVDKQKAKQKFVHLFKAKTVEQTTELLGLITTNIDQRIASGQWDLSNKHFIQGPAKYLLGRLWEDEVIGVSNGNGAPLPTAQNFESGRF